MSYTFAADRVALVTGAARGQGRAHAVSLARHGVKVSLLDICGSVDTVPYAAATREDLAETVALARAAGGEAIEAVVDVRDLSGLTNVAEQTVAAFGKIDFLVANAGIWSYAGHTHELSPEHWQTMIDVNLTGVWNCAKVVLPYMLQNNFGRIVATTSGTIQHTGENVAHYAAAKAGVLSLMKSVAVEYGKQGITASTVSPTNVATDMILHQTLYDVYCPDLENPTQAQAIERFYSIHAMDVAYIEPQDVADAVVFLLAEESKYITGIELPVLAGRVGGL